MAEPKDTPDHWRPPKAGGRNYGGGSTPGPSGSRSKTSSPTAQTTVMKTAAAKKAAPAKKAAAKSGVKKGAAAEVAGGGPEDPLADAAAAGSLLSGLKSGAKKAPKPGKAFGASNPARWVLVEFLVCFVILGLGTIVAPEGQKNSGASHLAVKGSALALLFFILGLMTGGGAKSAKAAGALGGLVTAAYVFTSRDAANLIKWVDSFFSSSSSSSAAAGAGAAAGAAGGAVAAGLTGAAE